MVLGDDSQTPSSHRGFFFARGPGEHAADRKQQGHRIVANNSKPIAFRQITAAEFARLSSSMQITLLTIRRAQLSSRKAIAATAERKRRLGET
jgi:hypothetical protein